MEGFTKDLFELHAELATMEFIKGADNPFYKSKYLDLPTLHKQVQPVLNKHSFVWYTRPGNVEGKPTLGYTLLHKTGAMIEGETILPHEGMDAQKMGAAITYFRRFVLTSVLDIVADSDDDGNKAAGKQAPKDTTKETYISAIEDMYAKLGESVNKQSLETMSENDLVKLGKELAAKLEG